METTYRHLSDEDTIEHASARYEGREPETESPLTPKICPTCKTQLDTDAKACGRCGAVFTPDAKAAEDQYQKDAQEANRQVEPDSEGADRVDALAEALEEVDADRRAEALAAAIEQADDDE